MGYDLWVDNPLGSEDNIRRFGHDGTESKGRSEKAPSTRLQRDLR